MDFAFIVPHVPGTTEPHDHKQQSNHKNGQPADDRCSEIRGREDSMVDGRKVECRQESIKKHNQPAAACARFETDARVPEKIFSIHCAPSMSGSVEGLLIAVFITAPMPMI